MRFRSLVLGVFIASSALAVVSPAEADTLVIKNPGDHPDYRFEAEPHGLIGFGGPFKKRGDNFGAGFRGTIIIVDNGFIKSINNSVGISFGADFFFGRGRLYFPVAMQWNFWLSTHWSVFGEPGISFTTKDNDIDPVLMVGGRYHFTEKIALTMRIGYPAFSVGASFMF